MQNNWNEEFEFRNIYPQEIEEAVQIEQICFPPNEACAAEDMQKRVERAPELFLVAVDRRAGVIAGFLNGLATGEDRFRDDFFTDVNTHDPDGKNIMLLGLDVRPEYRGRGLATEIVRRYARREAGKGRKNLILTCLDSRVPMYEKMGFQNRGFANSTWGGEQWYEMRIALPGFETLIAAAVQMRKRAYVPYSHFTVGAALLTESGDIFHGCNIENSSYSATMCAERTALFKAVSEGHRNFISVAIVGGHEKSEPVAYCNPCGSCLQVLREFCENDLRVIIAKSENDWKLYQLKDLLPVQFNDFSN